MNWNIAASLLLGATVATASGTLLDVIDRINRRYTGSATTRATELGLDTTRVRDALRGWWLITFLVFWFVCFILRMPPVSVVLTVFLISLPRTVLLFWGERRRILLRDQMVAACRSLASQLRAGLKVPSGIESVTADLSMPLKAEFQKVHEDYSLRGVEMQTALLEMKNRLRIEAVSLFTTVLLACQNRGGDSTLAMDKISQSLEQLQQVELKVTTNTASGRLTIYVLAAFPIFFTMFIYLIDPESIGLLRTTFAGQIVISLIMVLTYAAVRWAFYLIKAIE